MAQLIVETQKIIDNLNAVREICEGSEIIGVVKGDGYGLGAVALSKLLIENGVSTLAVATIEEAQALRSGGTEGEILLLSPTSIEAVAKKIVALDITASIGSAESAAALENAAFDAGKTARAHIKLDSGFSRFGFDCADIQSAAAILRSLKNVELTGVFSHLACSFGKKKLVEQPLRLFKQAVEELAANNISPKTVHLANSCAALRFPETRFNAVRIGSALTGRLPVKNRYGLKKVGYLACPIDELRWLPKGRYVGYANCYKTKKPTRIAVVPLGYGDGYALAKARDAIRLRDRVRYLFNDAKFLIGRNALYGRINGKRAAVLGRVGLSNLVLDVTGIEARPNDVAEFDCNILTVDSRIKRIYE